ncbi:DNA polymerase III subunit delta' [Nissabacter sp. SGAir0207]|uniref:DNA polymerase III subunit delta' n=1 Tax=Nissabacter sp. SGAir0207 TaxID=2126321 RepID=UPI0010CCFD04|nr:DNA polymerase III subunit delta' [Nissabacter sp. SGAir0207]QCR36431.1 DNA polymerase III subunit delta' [Nissabacter sp. SGAir0207]
MNWYPWLNGPYRQLIGQYQAGRGHHALLIQAEEGNGADALVYGLSRWLLCQHPQGEKSCGECHSCRLMLAGNHPDWHVLAPEKGKSALGIDRVRQVIDSLYHHAQQGGAKVVWLAQAEGLTEAAANALLKTLEEPPEKTHFLLGCRSAARLLPTLRSRCSYWPLPTPPEALSSQWILRQQPAEAQSVATALKLSRGAPLAAAALLQPERWQQRQQLCRMLGELLPTRNLLALLPQLNHEDAAERLHWLSTLLLDALKWQQGAFHYLLNQDQQPLAAALAAAHSPGALQATLQAWLTCRHQLLTVTAVNRELLLTECLLGWEARLAAPTPSF